MGEWIATAFLVIICGPALAYAVLVIAGEWRSEARATRAMAATRRTEVVNGHEYSVVTRRHSVVREKRTGRMGVVMNVGAERDIAHVKGGGIEMVPRWASVQFVRKADGVPGRVEWRSLRLFEVEGTTEVDYLSRRTGWLRTESLVRFQPIATTARRAKSRRPASS